MIVYELNIMNNSVYIINYGFYYLTNLGII